MLWGLFIQGRSMKRAELLLGLLSALIMSGCGSSKGKDPWDTVYPAKGIVTYKGKPVADAEIALFPQGTSIPDTIRPRAKTSEDGTFVVWTNQPGDGAPAGSYKITVVHYPFGEKNGVAFVKPNDLPAKYSRLQSTDLVAEIGQKETEIPPIELK